MFFDILQQKCKEKGVKLTPLLQSLGLSTGNIGRWRKGAIPKGETLNKLAQALDCSVDFLLERTDNKKDLEKIEEQIYYALKQRPDGDLFINEEGITNLGWEFVKEAANSYKVKKEVKKED